MGVDLKQCCSDIILKFYLLSFTFESQICSIYTAKFEPFKSYVDRF